MPTLDTVHANRRDATQLAVERTRLAYERTLMAWVRTATSLISFGFTIFKFFEFLHQDGKVEKPPQFLGARQFALLMIVIGLVGLVIATIQHERSMRMMRAEFGPLPISLAAIMATLIGILGLVGVFSVLFRV